MLAKNFTAAWLKAALLASLSSHTQALQLLGSSFGVPGDNVTYDYVVIGGGNAGLTVAARLVEQNAGTVAIIEAGTFYELSSGNISQVPATGDYFAGKDRTDTQPLVDWGYDTVAQPDFYGAYNQSTHYARGKTLGGCTARNFMVYQRGSEGSYQQWADTVGDQSYTWANFKSFFKKSVNFTEPDMNLRFANSTPEYNATDAGDQLGPLSVTFPSYAHAFGTWAYKGFQQIGIPSIPGFLSGNLLGTSWATFTLDATKMTRDSSETSFLRVGIENPALTVYPLATAKKILFDETKKATGVVVQTGGIDDEMNYVLSARKEVILAAGVFGSPQLLMVSGVGPAETLKSLRIPVVADRPGVGQGMQDHLFFGIAYRVNVITISSISDPIYAAEQAALYQQAAGIYTAPVTDVLAWEKIPQDLRANWSSETHNALNAYPDDWPEVEYISIPGYLGNQDVSRHEGPDDSFNYATVSSALVAPRSIGSISISSPDTNVAPLVHTNYLREQSDIDITVAAFKRIRQLFASDALQNITIGEEYFPGPSVQTDEQIEDFIRTSMSTIWHATSTCAMGKVNDTNTVVDTKGRVVGVQGVRVVDAAAFPFVPPGHPMSTIYALAEKLACDISGNC
ncbi:hypothetical protein B7494_g4805 [Chlorociboria aeruginascens]|nr:hypothetical protein B7494_g4805 [Chlorociboria aeruginascens]